MLNFITFCMLIVDNYIKIQSTVPLYWHSPHSRQTQCDRPWASFCRNPSAGPPSSYSQSQGWSEQIRVNGDVDNDNDSIENEDDTDRDGAGGVSVGVVRPALVVALVSRAQVLNQQHHPPGLLVVPGLLPLALPPLHLPSTSPCKNLQSQPDWKASSCD